MRVQQHYFRRLMVACCLALIAPALSAQGQDRASQPPAPKPAAAEVAPSSPSAREESRGAKDAIATDKTPAQPAAAPAPATAPAPAPVPVPVPRHIALILPLGSKTLGKVADAVRLGFIAGANAEGKNAVAYRVYAADDEAASLAAQYRRAASDSAMAIIGGATRDGASALAREAGYVPTLALNAPAVASDNDLPNQFFHISLNLDWEARLAARAATDDGLRRVAVVSAGSPLAKRIQDSFEKEWLRLGGEVAVRIALGNELTDGSRVTSTMEKANADVVFLATEARVARFARPYLPVGIPVFATSLTIDPNANAVENLDLESVRFMEMPWFVQPDHPAVMAYARPLEPLPIDYERLYALGIDAWRIAQNLIANPKQPIQLDGVTGRISLDGRQFVRQLAAGEIRDGRPTLFKPGE